MTAQWTVDDNDLLVYDNRILPIPFKWPDGMVAYNALVADVRAARDHDENCITTSDDVARLLAQRDELRRMVDDMVAVIRRLDEALTEWEAAPHSAIDIPTAKVISAARLLAAVHHAR